MIKWKFWKLRFLTTSAFSTETSPAESRPSLFCVVGIQVLWIHFRSSVHLVGGHPQLILIALCLHSRIFLDHLPLFDIAIYPTHLYLFSPEHHIHLSFCESLFPKSVYWIYFDICSFHAVASTSYSLTVDQNIWKTGQIVIFW